MNDMNDNEMSTLLASIDSKKDELDKDNAAALAAMGKERDAVIASLIDQMDACERIIRISYHLDVLRRFSRDPFAIDNHGIGILRKGAANGTCICGIGVHITNHDENEHDAIIALMPEQCYTFTAYSYSYCQGSWHPERHEAGIYKITAESEKLNIEHLPAIPNSCHPADMQFYSNQAQEMIQALRTLNEALPSFEQEYWAYARELAK